MALGYRGIAALLASPFAAYAAAGAVQGYRAVVGIPAARVEPLPPADESAKGRSRSQKAGAVYQAVGGAAFMFAPDVIDTNGVDDADKFRRGILERNYALDNLRVFLAGGGKGGEFRGATKRDFETAGK